jgi:uncharacterized protein YndB with AHSA1/START domain
MQPRDLPNGTNRAIARSLEPRATDGSRAWVANSSTEDYMQPTGCVLHAVAIPPMRPRQERRTSMPTVENGPIAKAEMMIRKPIDEVFNALIDPAVTTQFWFTKSTGKLEAGKRVRWEWEMYGAGTDVDVKEIERNKRILIEWDSYVGRTPVEWQFAARPDNTTMVKVTNYGFQGEDVVHQAIDSTQGFTFMLAGLKALLEHGIRLDLVADKSPDAHAKGWRGR